MPPATLHNVGVITKLYFVIFAAIKVSVTNLITPRALFSSTYLLNVVTPEIAPFDPPTSKTPP